MSEDRRPGNAPREARRSRLGLFLALGAGIALLLWGVSKLVPGRTFEGEDWAHVVYSLAFAALVATSLFGRGLKLGQTLRYLLIWAAIGMGVLVAYSFRDEIGGIANRVGADVVPGRAAITGANEIALTREQGEHFVVTGEVNGVAVRFLVDTGASGVVLSPADARRVGVDPAALDYVGEFETANGIGRGAPFLARSLSVGPIRMTDVRMSINQAPMSGSLLGMTFLNRLESYEVRGDRLFLRWSGS